MATGIIYMPLSGTVTRIAGNTFNCSGGSMHIDIGAPAPRPVKLYADGPILSFYVEHGDQCCSSSTCGSEFKRFLKIFSFR